MNASYSLAGLATVLGSRRESAGSPAAVRWRACGVRPLLRGLRLGNERIDVLPHERFDLGRELRERGLVVLRVVWPRELEEHPPLGLQSLCGAPVRAVVLPVAEEALECRGGRDDQAEAEGHPAQSFGDVGRPEVQADERRDEDAADNRHEPQRVIAALVAPRPSFEPEQLLEPATVEESLLEIFERKAVDHLAELPLQLRGVRIA